MRQLRMIRWVLITGICCIPSLAHAQLLKGKVVGTDLKAVTVEYSPTGDIMEREYREIPVKDGTFEFDLDMPVESTDVEVVTDMGHAFGAHLTKGKTVQMTIEKRGDDLTASFSGDNADVSRVVSRMATAYNIMRYFSLDENDKTTYEEYRALLDSEYKAVKGLLKGIKNKDTRKYYTLLNDGKYKEQALRLIQNEAYEVGKQPGEYPEYTDILKGVDINNEIDIASGLSLTKLLSMTTASQGFKTDMGPYCTEIMQLANQYVTNTRLRRSIVNTVGYNYFTFGDDSGDYHAFFEEYKKFAGTENADIPKQYESKIAAWDKTHSGVPAPDITLTDRDDKQIQLSSLKGKFTYIDVWATWCGPCKKEIPFMEKLVERFKDNDKVQFISISIDENVKAWKTMIENDKPAWPQYNINGETAKQFSADWGISGIPRFIMIDKNGNIFSADATRPSEEKTAQTIIEQTK